MRVVPPRLFARFAALLGGGAVALAVLALLVSVTASPRPASVTEAVHPDGLAAAHANPPLSAQPVLNVVAAAGTITARQWQPESGPALVSPTVANAVRNVAPNAARASAPASPRPPLRVLLCSWQI